MIQQKLYDLVVSRNAKLGNLEMARRYITRCQEETLKAVDNDMGIEKVALRVSEEREAQEACELCEKLLISDEKELRQLCRRIIELGS